MLDHACADVFSCRSVCYALLELVFCVAASGWLPCRLQGLAGTLRTNQTVYYHGVCVLCGYGHLVVIDRTSLNCTWLHAAIWVLQEALLASACRMQHMAVWVGVVPVRQRTCSGMTAALASFAGTSAVAVPLTSKVMGDCAVVWCSGGGERHFGGAVWQSASSIGCEFWVMASATAVAPAGDCSLFSCV